MKAEEYNKTVDSYSDNVYRFILKSVKSEMLAEDIVQDAYEKLWIRHEEIEFDKSKAWLFSTAYHTMIDMVRREKKQGEWDFSKDYKLEGQDEYDNVNEVLHKAIETLPNNQKSVLLLRDYEGYSYSEIEEITGLNQAQVKVYIYRARLYLRNYLVKLNVSVS